MFYYACNFNFLKKFCTEEEYKQLEELAVLANLMGYHLVVLHEANGNDIHAVDLQIKDLILRFNKLAGKNIYLLYSYIEETNDKIDKFFKNKKNTLLSLKDYIDFIKENL